MPITSAPPTRQSLRLGDLLRVLRPYQWVKNLLVFVPLLLAHRASDLQSLRANAWGFVALCLCASAGYLLNDLRDLQSDRDHPWKRHRPLASGAVPTAIVVPMVAALLAVAFGISFWLLPPVFSLLLATYVFGTILYSFWLKSRLLVDVFVLAGLYTLRLIAGGQAVGIELTPWLLAFSTFLFLSLAFAKRYAELAAAGSDEPTHLRARNYRQDDMPMIAGVGAASGYLAVLVLAIYLNSDLARQLYRHPGFLWALCYLLLYWMTRIWFCARRGLLHEDPILFAIRDGVSWLVALVAVALVVLAAVLP